MQKRNYDHRFILTLTWTVLAAAIVLYALVKYGSAHLEIVTLILGLVGNQLLGGPNGVYFGGNHAGKVAPPAGDTTVTTETTATVSTTPNT